jgi:hypothetical protein
MASLALWKDDSVGICALWNKQDPYSVIIYSKPPDRPESIKYFPTEERAIAYAKRKARELKRKES